MSYTKIVPYIGIKYRNSSTKTSSSTFFAKNGGLTPKCSATGKKSLENCDSLSSSDKKWFLYRFPEKSSCISTSDVRNHFYNSSESQKNKTEGKFNKTLLHAVNNSINLKAVKVFEKADFNHFDNILKCTPSFRSNKSYKNSIELLYSLDNEHKEFNCNKILEEKKVTVKEMKSETINLANTREFSTTSRTLTQDIKVKNENNYLDNENKTKKDSLVRNISLDKILQSLPSSSSKSNISEAKQNKLTELFDNKNQLQEKVNVIYDEKGTKEINLTKPDVFKIPSWLNDFFSRFTDKKSTDTEEGEEDQKVLSTAVTNDSDKNDDLKKDLADIEKTIRDHFKRNRDSLAVIILKFSNDKKISKPDIETIIRNSLEKELERVLSPDPDKTEPAEDKTPIIEKKSKVETENPELFSPEVFQTVKNTFVSNNEQREVTDKAKNTIDNNSEQMSVEDKILRKTVQEEIEVEEAQHIENHPEEVVERSGFEKAEIQRQFQSYNFNDNPYDIQHVQSNENKTNQPSW